MSKNGGQLRLAKQLIEGLNVFSIDCDISLPRGPGKAQATQNDLHHKLNQNYTCYFAVHLIDRDTIIFTIGIFKRQMHCSAASQSSLQDKDEAEWLTDISSLAETAFSQQFWRHVRDLQQAIHQPGQKSEKRH